MNTLRELQLLHTTNVVLALSVDVPYLLEADIIYFENLGNFFKDPMSTEFLAVFLKNLKTSAIASSLTRNDSPNGRPFSDSTHSPTNLFLFRGWTVLEAR